VFKDVQPEDWVLCSWRSHYQCLLKGVPPERLKADILDGKSMALCYKDYNIFSSAIVGGTLPIAVGVAMDLKRNGAPGKVWVFLGDMTSETGNAHECIKYSINKDLPIHFVIEDNGKSVCTNTRETWSMNELTYENFDSKFVTYYKYKLDKYPHAGAGTRVSF